MTNSLKNSPELIDKLLMLVRGQGMRVATAARQLGLKPRHCQEFFAQEKAWMREWWDEHYDSVNDYFNGIDRCEGDTWHLENEDWVDELKIGDYQAVDCPTPEHQIGIWPPYKPEKHKPITGSKWEMFEAMGLFSKPKKILVIADTQCKPDESLDYMKWIGRYIFDKKPDVVVHIGDHYDFPSLSSYDKGKKSFEGRRLKADIEAGNKGMELLLAEFQKDGYSPRLVFCSGNHEFRFDRLAEDVPELTGFVGLDTLPLIAMGWEVYPFLKPVEIEGIFFVHFLANPMTGKPYAGTAANQLKTVGRSFVVGHKQVLDVAIRNTLDGKQQIGIINGACYPFDEGYKGYQGNAHFRGITMLHEVKDGSALPMFVSLDYLQKRYEE